MVLSLTVRKGILTICIDEESDIGPVVQNMSIKFHFPLNLMVPSPFEARSSDLFSSSGFRTSNSLARGVSLKSPITIMFPKPAL